MMGPTHKVWAALAGAATAYVQTHSIPMIALSAVVATGSATGWTSPDIDQTAPWRAVARRMPRLVQRAMGHRHVTHWFGLPVAAWFAIPLFPAEARWAATALLVGWVSHLLGDLLFGKIPLLPTGRWAVGLTFDTGGRVEDMARVLSGIGIAGLLVAPLLT